MYPKRRHAEDFAGNPVGGHDRAGHAAVLLQYDRPTENRSGSPDAAARGPAEAPHEIRDARHLCSNTDWNMDAIMAHYEVLQQYLPWEDQGVVLAKNVFARKDIEGTDYPPAAKALGERL